MASRESPECFEAHCAKEQRRAEEADRLRLERADRETEQRLRENEEAERSWMLQELARTRVEDLRRANEEWQR